MRSKKVPVDFLSGLRSLETDTVQRRPRPAPAADEQPGEGKGAPAGKVAITQWVDPAVRKQLAQIGLDHDKTQAELAAEALNLLFEKYGKSPIAAA